MMMMMVVVVMMMMEMSRQVSTSCNTKPRTFTVRLTAHNDNTNNYKRRIAT